MNVTIVTENSVIDLADWEMVRAEPEASGPKVISIIAMRSPTKKAITSSYELAWEKHTFLRISGDGATESAKECLKRIALAVGRGERLVWLTNDFLDEVKRGLMLLAKPIGELSLPSGIIAELTVKCGLRTVADLVKLS